MSMYLVKDNFQLKGTRFPCCSLIAGTLILSKNAQGRKYLIPYILPYILYTLSFIHLKPNIPYTFCTLYFSYPYTLHLL